MKCPKCGCEMDLMTNWTGEEWYECPECHEGYREFE